MKRLAQRARKVALSFGVLAIASGAAMAACGFTNSGEVPLLDPGPAKGASSAGERICHDFSKVMQGTSSNWAAVAWCAGIIGTLATIVGGTLGVGKDGDRLVRRSGGVLLASVGSLLAAASAYSVSRSNAASDAAARATRAREKEDDLDRYRDCLEARALWLESRSVSLDHSPPQSANKTKPTEGQKPDKTREPPQ